MIFKTPRPFKRGQYIMNRYRKTDVLIIAITLLVCILSIIIYLNYLVSESIVTNLLVVLFLLLPIAVIYLLFLPMPTYFNLLDFFKVIIKWKFRKKEWRWEGIYLFDEDEEVILKGVDNDEIFEKEESADRTEKSKKRSSHDSIVD